MKRCTLWAVVLLLAGTANVFANGGIPPVPPGPNIQIGARNAELVVEIDNNTKEARLQVPLKFLVGGGKPRLGADAGHVPTLIAGLALTCAFVSGGFWLVRRSRGRGLTALLLGLSLLAAVTSVSADLIIKPKPAKEAPTAVALPAEIEFTGKIVLEVVPTGDKIKLLISKDMIKKSAEKPKKD